jgi:hypothetical protein
LDSSTTVVLGSSLDSNIVLGSSLDLSLDSSTTGELVDVRIKVKWRLDVIKMHVKYNVIMIEVEPIMIDMKGDMVWINHLRLDVINMHMEDNVIMIVVELIMIKMKGDMVWIDLLRQWINLWRLNVVKSHIRQRINLRRLNVVKSHIRQRIVRGSTSSRIA